ncbi:MAG: sulfatase [Acidobacteriota bacterium]
MSERSSAAASGWKRADGVLLGFLLVAGWLLHDLALMASQVSPTLSRRMVLPSLVLAAGALIIAFCVSVHKSLYAAALGAVATFSLATAFRNPGLDPALLGASKSLLVLLLAGGWMSLLPRRWRWASLPLGLTLAALAAAARRLRWGSLDASYLLFEALLAGLGLCLFATYARPSSNARRGFRLAVWLTFGLLTAASGWHVSQLRRPDLAPTGTPAEPDRPNLLLIVLDTVRADHLTWHGYPRATTPGLERSVREGFTIYSNARATSSWTLPSHGSLLTGLLPSGHNARHNRLAETQTLGTFAVTLLRDDVPTLAERLAAHGYRAGAIVANSTVLAHEMGLDRGFHHYDDRHPAGLSCRQLLVQQAGWRPELGCLRYRDAQTITDLALGWLDQDRARDSFLFLNYMDAHSPYVPPAPYDRAFSTERPVDPLKPPRELQSLQYDRQLLYLDHHLMRLFEGLKVRQLWRDTVVIVTSDHGEAFGEHQHWGHNTHLYEELIHVPLVVKSAEQNAAGQMHASISGHEVFALALSELGLGPAPGTSDDLSLIAEWYNSKPRAAGARKGSRDLLAWLDGTFKIIANSRGELEVYDLQRDGEESQNLAGSWPAAERVRQLSRDHWATAQASGEAPTLSPELIENLKALGYL